MGNRTPTTSNMYSYCSVYHNGWRSNYERKQNNIPIEMCIISKRISNAQLLPVGGIKCFFKFKNKQN